MFWISFENCYDCQKKGHKKKFSFHFYSFPCHSIFQYYSLEKNITIAWSTETNEAQFLLIGAMKKTIHSVPESSSRN